MRQSIPVAARRRIIFVVELIVERVDGDRLALARRVHEAMIADVDADVVDLAAVDLEEHQVAALELAALHFLRFPGLLARSARHGEPHLLMRVEHEAAAVETLARGAAVAIARALQREREVREGVAGWERFGRAGAAGEQEREQQAN